MFSGKMVSILRQADVSEYLFLEHRGVSLSSRRILGCRARVLQCNWKNGTVNFNISARNTLCLLIIESIKYSFRSHT